MYCISPKLGVMRWPHSISRIPYPGATDEFKEKCLIALAEATSNVSICNFLDKTDKNKCISGIAESTNNKNLCKLIDIKDVNFEFCVLFGTNFPDPNTANQYIEEFKKNM